MQRFAPSRSLSLCPTSPPYHKNYTRVLYKCVIRMYNSRGEQECGKEVRGEPTAKGTCREGAGWIHGRQGGTSRCGNGQGWGSPRWGPAGQQTFRLVGTLAG